MDAKKRSRPQPPEKRRGSRYRAALRSAILRNFTGLGWSISRLLREHGYGLRAVVSGEPVQQIILDGIEEVCWGILSGNVPETVQKLHEGSKSSGGALDRLVERISDAYREANRDLPPGIRWTAKPAERFTIGDLLDFFDEAEPDAAPSGNMARQEDALKRLIEIEVWVRLRRALSEVWHVPTRHRDQHLAMVPSQVRRIVRREFETIELATTGDLFLCDMGA